MVFACFLRGHDPDQVKGQVLTALSQPIP